MATREQIERAKAIVMKDCKGAGRLVDDYGRTCALGALGRAAGLSDYELHLDRDYVKIGKVLHTTFGLSAKVFWKIIDANDTNNTPKERRKAVCAVLDTVVIEEDN